MPATKPNVAALVEQMPDTDSDILFKQPDEKPSANPAAPTKPKPKPERLGLASKFTGPEPEAAGKIFAEILSGGRESIVELVGLIREPGEADYKSYKAGYVLHGLVIQVGRPGQDEQRKLLADTLASQLDGGKLSQLVKGRIIRELRTLGDKDAVPAIGKALLDEELSADAAQALLTIRDGAAPHFRTALEKSQGKNRVSFIQALGYLRDTESAPALTKALADPDREIRRIAAWALANIGDAGTADALMKSADAAEASERSQATGYCLLLAERLAALGKKPDAVRIYTHLRDTRKDPAERHIRDAAGTALGAIAN